ncbi:hypothetical protein DA456_18850 [Pseudomonas syringae pv. atrofaciens]|uniref:Uncharacterized protein n=1 Tax=Pseudomonas syringae pv. atrofaciens TaxID=192087 RepID=A0AAD0IB62_PSESX|nr:hypothetical protein DA456_18850 [Pseudomonas syringae pv. atrofaciens]PBP72213.1 hypothetical protein CCL15_10720 [Pseudomonas syringae]PBQ03761.1 hypothetical protein CCL23_23825 [Pseudomonas syringae]
MLLRPTTAIQQGAWNGAMGKRYVDEYNETGRSTQTLVMLLARYIILSGPARRTCCPPRSTESSLADLLW